jgi:isoquinoline 1-oxidoreductase subunit alpha
MPSLTVNGKSLDVDADPDTPLLWVLRDHLGLTGTKFGCGRACVTPLEAVGTSEVTTIEGLSDKVAHAVQTAWQQLDVVQCGYCQSGQIMTTVALLNEMPKPTDTDIDSALTGNICRCATYHRIRAAVHEAARLLET